MHELRRSVVTSVITAAVFAGGDGGDGSSKTAATPAPGGDKARAALEKLEGSMVSTRS